MGEVGWLGHATQRLRRLLPLVAHKLGVPLSADTLRRLARRAGYTCKRIRRSLKAHCARCFSASQQQLTTLQAPEVENNGRVVYADEGCFSRQAPGQSLTSYVLPGVLTAEFFVAAWDEYSQTLPGPIVLACSTMPQCAACVQAGHAVWAARRLHLQLLPAYYSELNLIEILWHRCKH